MISFNPFFSLGDISENPLITPPITVNIKINNIFMLCNDLAIAHADLPATVQELLYSNNTAQLLRRTIYKFNVRSDDCKTASSHLTVVRLCPFAFVGSSTLYFHHLGMLANGQLRIELHVAEEVIRRMFDAEIEERMRVNGVTDVQIVLSRRLPTTC